MCHTYVWWTRCTYNKATHTCICTVKNLSFHMATHNKEPHSDRPFLGCPGLTDWTHTLEMHFHKTIHANIYGSCCCRCVRFCANNLRLLLGSLGSHNDFHCALALECLNYVHLHCQAVTFGLFPVFFFYLFVLSICESSAFTQLYGDVK